MFNPWKRVRLLVRLVEVKNQQIELLTQQIQLLKDLHAAEQWLAHVDHIFAPTPQIELWTLTPVNEYVN